MTLGKANRQSNPENGASGSESGVKLESSGYGKALFVIIERRLKSPSKREAYIPPEEMAGALRYNPGVPLPPAIHDYLCDFLEGKVQAPRGRPADTEIPWSQINKILIPPTYERYYTWLKKRKRSMGLSGWKSIRSADWWQGPPSERAARMTCRRLRLAISWRRVQNIVSEAKK
jgi:hypothetical protein